MRYSLDVFDIGIWLLYIKYKQDFKKKSHFSVVLDMCAGFPRYILKSIKFDKQGKGQDMCSLYLCFNLIYNVYNVFWACSDLKFDHNRTLKDLSYDGIFHMYTHLNCIFCAEAFKRSSIKKYYRYYLSMKNFEL